MAEQGNASVLLHSLHDQLSYLLLTLKEGHVEVVSVSISAEEEHGEVVRALLEVGGRELVMLTDNDGTSCMYMSAQNVHLEMVKAMLEAGGCELVMPTMDDGASCLTIARQGFNFFKGH